MKKSILVLLAAVAIVTVVSLLGVDDSSVARQDERTDPRKKQVRDRLQQKGYTNISFGDVLPSTDGAYVIHFSALSPNGESKRGVALLFRDELRLY